MKKDQRRMVTGSRLHKKVGMSVTSLYPAVGKKEGVRQWRPGEETAGEEPEGEGIRVRGRKKE